MRNLVSPSWRVTPTSNFTYWSSVHIAAIESPKTGPSHPQGSIDPPAIWAHLYSVFNMVRDGYQVINCLHVLSDNPVTQYKQEGNFYLLLKEPFKEGFKQISWNFFEASHGNWAPDGVWDTLKRSADKIVYHGGDIPNVKAMFRQLKDIGISAVIRRGH